MANPFPPNPAGPPIPKFGGFIVQTGARLAYVAKGGGAALDLSLDSAYSVDRCEPPRGLVLGGGNPLRPIGATTYWPNAGGQELAHRAA